MPKRSSKAPDVRTNVVFSQEDHRRIKRVAKFKGVSFAEFVRNAVRNEIWLDDEPPVIDNRKAPRDLAAKHDKYLYGKKA